MNWIIALVISFSANAKMFKAESFVAANKGKHPYLEDVTNSVVRVFNPLTGSGSGVVLGQTPQGHTIILTSNHNLRFNSRESERAGIKGGWEIAVEKTEYITSYQESKSDPDGGIHYLGFPLFAPPPLSESGAAIKPSQDFAVAVLTGMTLTELRESTILEATQSPAVNPPASFREVAIAEPENEVMAIGYSGANGKVISTGFVESDELAEILLANDVHPYDRNSEFVMSAPVQVGMSGGGVFDSQGRLLGVTARRFSMTSNGQVYELARVVRASHILSMVKARLEKPFADARSAEVLHGISKSSGELDSCVRALR